MDRLTMTSDKGGLAFTFDLDFRSQPSEARKILALGERLKAYEDAEEQRNKGCEYCNDGYDLEIGKCCEPDLYIEGNHLIALRYDEHDSKADINFCPMCGRKLEED